jgi:hypothetical protein
VDVYALAKKEELFTISQEGKAPEEGITEGKVGAQKKPTLTPRHALLTVSL